MGNLAYFLLRSATRILDRLQVQDTLQYEENFRLHLPRTFSATDHTLRRGFRPCYRVTRCLSLGRHSCDGAAVGGFSRNCTILLHLHHFFHTERSGFTTTE